MESNKRRKSPKRNHGTAAFEEYYSGLFGERWPGLASALRKEGSAVDFASGLERPYRLDSASIGAALALRMPESGEVLDACAAPGGKTLVLSSRSSPETRLVANELSADRRRRLLAVLDAHLSHEMRSRVSVIGRDAAALCRSRRACYAAIMLDAPCSSERHVMADPSRLAEWSSARPEALARRQWSLLSSCFLMLAPGGSLVYSTCALNPAENDGVARRLFEKYPLEAELDVGGLADAMPDAARPAEATRFGIIVLPDVARGAGPMYVMRVRKKDLGSVPCP